MFVYFQRPMAESATRVFERAEVLGLKVANTQLPGLLPPNSKLCSKPFAKSLPKEFIFATLALDTTAPSISDSLYINETGGLKILLEAKSTSPLKLTLTTAVAT